MRTRALLSGIFASASILVIGWQAGAAQIAATTAATAASAAVSASKPPANSTTSPPSATATPSATPPTAPPAPQPPSKSGTYTGASVSTEYGNVQVQISVVSGKIADVIAVHLTDDGGRSVQISAHAAPLLRSEVLQSQSARVATVGGATYTSDAYLTSLQSALDQAGM